MTTGTYKCVSSSTDSDSAEAHITALKVIEGIDSFQIFHFIITVC